MGGIRSFGRSSASLVDGRIWIRTAKKGEKKGGRSAEGVSSGGEMETLSESRDETTHLERVRR